MITKGYRCNYITVLKKEIRNKATYYLCQCKCGSVRYYGDATIRYNNIEDCGCHLFRLDIAKEKYIGKRFNCLTIKDCYIKPDGKNKNIFVQCICDCGNITNALLTEIKNNHTKSCGCINKFNFDRDYKNKVFNGITILDMVKQHKIPSESDVKCRCHCGEIFVSRIINLIKKKRYIVACPKCNGKDTPKYNVPQYKELKDGKLKTILYGMRGRCYNPKKFDYKWYGGKGVQLCDEWKTSSDNFVSWALNNGYKQGLTIDRIDPNGNYEPSNCRWVDMVEQNNNHSNSKKYLFNNKYLTLAQIAKETGINYRTLLSRIGRQKMSIEDATTKPIKSNKK